MFKPAGFQVLEKLYQGRDSIIYRAVKIVDQQPVIIKVSVTRSLDHKSDKLSHEYTIRQNIQSDYVINFLELDWDTGYGSILVEEDEQGKRLTDCILPGGFNVAEFLNVAIQLAQGLCDIHRGNVIHKDIKPSNILWISTKGKIKYIDFGNATPLRQFKQIMTHPNYFSEGTLNYISPEQTGRMNRSVDYRTDFYSLGVTYYQLLTGHLPFIANNSLEILYNHIAKIPVAPHIIKSEIPTSLSNIIMKLLSKDVEARYQSAKSLLADLKQCAMELQEKGEIGYFELGQGDFSEFFCIPQKLYGREKELDTLLKISERMHHGYSEICMITGPAGVGKTVLVKEIQKYNLNQADYFLYGKFEQLNRNIAYSAIIQAFQAWVKQLLISESNILTNWKDYLLQAVGNNGQLLIEVIPELELIIGSQPPLLALETNQKKNKFHFSFQAFISALATQQHPLILFLDDLQWADVASLNLLESIFSNHKIKYFLLIGAYRDKEVDVSHPGLLTLNAIGKRGVNINNIVLSPLSINNLQQWLADTFHCSFQDVDEITNLVYLKTQGNPFFIKSFLQALYNEQAILPSEKQGWKWNLEKIRLHPATDNVVEFMEAQLTKMPEKTQELIKISSCIGHSFTLSILQHIVQEDEQEILKCLQPLLDADMIIQYDKNFKFNHDRIQEAIQSMLPMEKRAAIHSAIGWLLENCLSENSSQLQFFEAVDHLNKGRLLAIRPQEKLNLARLNLQAGEKAKNAIAYNAALNYLQTAEEYLAEIEIWKVDYQFSYKFYKEFREVEYLNNHFDRVVELSDLLLSKLCSALDQAETYSLLIVQNTVIARYQAALDLGFKALRLLGIEAAAENPERYVAIEYEQSRQKLEDKSIEILLSLANMERADKKVAMKLLYSMAAAAFIANQEFFPVLAIMMVNLTLDFGNTEESALGYGAYAIMLAANFHEMKLADDLAELAIKLSEKFNDLSNQCRTNYIYMAFINHWFNPLCEADKYIMKASQTGWEVGEFQYLGYVSQYQATYYFYKGLTLESVYLELFKLTLLPHNVNHQLVLDTIYAVQLVVLNLMGKTTKGNLFRDEKRTEIEYQIEWRRYKHDYTLCNYLILKAQALYFNNYFEEALDCIYMAEPYLPSIFSHFSRSIYYYYHSLIMTKIYCHQNEEKQKEFLEKLTENLAKLQQWARNCSKNYQHCYTLVAAEIAKIQKNKFEAIDLYNEAIDLLEKTDFTQEIALANELAANFWLENGKKHYARGLLDTAYNYYLRWGAHYKIDFLRKEYSHLLDIATHNQNNSSFDISGESSISAYSLNALNLSSILQASQAISKNIDLDKLLNSIMKIVIQNAGAQNGAFLLLEENELYVEAEYMIDGNINTLQRVPLAEWKNGAQSIVNQVSRTLHHVLLDNAYSTQMFSQDPYILGYQIKSVLCLPIIKHQQLKAILYLENNLSPYAFTEHHLDILLLLAGQMAISLENIQFFMRQLQSAQQIAAEQRARAEEAVLYRKNQEDFIDMVCHEIRNPMSAIYSHVDFMREFIITLKELRVQLPISVQFILDDTARQLEESINTINESICHQKNVVDNVLSLSKLESGKITLNPSIFQPKKMIEEIMKLFAIQLEDKNLQLIMELPNNGLLMKGDVDCLKMVIINLISNAIKFTEHGHIKVSLQTKPINENVATIVIQVEDTGMGLTGEEKSLLFQRFANTTSAAYGGHGLGLMISQKFIELMGGKIEVESEKNKGTTFTIKLVCEIAQLQETIKEESAQVFIPLSVVPARKVVLAVEDNTVNQKILMRQLKKAGHNCVIAGNGQEAVEKYQETEFDCILMDIEMPVMNGMEATKKIREIEYKSGRKFTPIIGLSANARNGFAAQALSIGMNDYLTKPYKQIDLLSKIKQWTSLPIEKKSIYGQFPVPLLFDPVSKQEEGTSSSSTSLPENSGDQSHSFIRNYGT